MCHLVETIKVTGRRLQHLNYHQERVDQSLRGLFHNSSLVDLHQIRVPPSITDAVHKCRVVYREKIIRVDFTPYTPKRIRRVKLVVSDYLEYPYKFEDRKEFRKLLDKNPEADDVIIIKHGEITDSSYCNLAFYDGRYWFTPKHPLLKGTCRTRLLRNGVILEANIGLRDLDRFYKISFINAMLDLSQIELPVTAILPK